MARRSPLERIETLTARISAIETEREGAIASAVVGRSSWAQIGRALGVTAQAAHKRYRWLRHSPTNEET
jgi:hypothetical protein